MKKAISAILLCLLGVMPLLSGCGRDGEPIPEAQAQFYVLDEPGVLDAATEDYIIAVNDSLCAQTGAQVVVVCVHTTGLASTDTYAYDLFNQWQIGDKQKNNGVLILLTVGEEDYWMLPGKGLEESFSGGIVKLMLNRYLEPDFAAGDYDAGVRKLFDAVVDHLEVQYSVTADPVPETDTLPPAESEKAPAEEIPYRESSNSAIIGWAIIIVIIILLLIGFSGGDGTHRRRRHVTHSSPRPRKTVYPYGTRMPKPASRPTIHRPGSYGGMIGRNSGSYGGTVGGSRTGNSYSGNRTGTSYGGRIGGTNRTGSSYGGSRAGSYGGKIGGSSRSGTSLGGTSRSGGGGISRGGGAGRR